MVGSSEEVAVSSGSAMDGFNDTRFGINFIQYNLTNFAETNTRPKGITDKSLQGKVTKVLFDHPKHVVGELDLVKGDEVYIEDNSTAHYTFVKFGDKYGYVATNHLDIQGARIATTASFSAHRTASQTNLSNN